MLYLAEPVVYAAQNSISNNFREIFWEPEGDGTTHWNKKAIWFQGKLSEWII